jgi:catechol 2,3-dioxygenase-like lactoylglutathione lyase family enzyme
VNAGPVSELRLVLTVDDFDAAVALFRDGLGMAQLADFSTERGSCLLLDVGAATLELTDTGHAAEIDELEVGRVTGARVRVALRIADADAATRAATGAGATLVAPPTATPWGSRNARLTVHPGLALTLYEQGGSETDATADETGTTQGSPGC